MFSQQLVLPKIFRKQIFYVHLKTRSWKLGVKWTMKLDINSFLFVGKICVFYLIFLELKRKSGNSRKYVAEQFFYICCKVRDWNVCHRWYHRQIFCEWIATYTWRESCRSIVPLYQPSLHVLEGGNQTSTSRPTQIEQVVQSKGRTRHENFPKSATFIVS